jgi:hypothetical protein
VAVHGTPHIHAIIVYLPRKIEGDVEGFRNLLNLRRHHGLHKLIEGRVVENFFVNFTHLGALAWFPQHFVIGVLIPECPLVGSGRVEPILETCCRLMCTDIRCRVHEDHGWRWILSLRKEPILVNVEGTNSGSQRKELLTSHGGQLSKLARPLVAISVNHGGNGIRAKGFQWGEGLDDLPTAVK